MNSVCGVVIRLWRVGAVGGVVICSIGGECICWVKKTRGCVEIMRFNWTYVVFYYFIYVCCVCANYALTTTESISHCVSYLLHLYREHCL